LDHIETKSRRSGIGSAGPDHPRYGKETDGRNRYKTDAHCPANSRTAQTASVSDLKALIQSKDADAYERQSLQKTECGFHAISR
jgi:hypothetical protein